MLDQRPALRQPGRKGTEEKVESKALERRPRARELKRMRVEMGHQRGMVVADKKGLKGSESCLTPKVQFTLEEVWCSNVCSDISLSPDPCRNETPRLGHLLSRPARHSWAASAATVVSSLPGTSITLLGDEERTLRSLLQCHA